MKIIFKTLLIALSISYPSFAQKDIAPVKEISNIEKFNSRSGTIFKKEFINIGKIKNCDIQVYKTHDLISKEKRSGVRFEFEYRSSVSNDTKIAVLDGDEIDGLIKAIEIIKSDILTTKSENYTEVTFKSRSGFEAGCFNSNESTNWSAYIKLEKYDNRSMVFLKNSELEDLIPILQNAKTLL
jgi:hypothetical protein